MVLIASSTQKKIFLAAAGIAVIVAISIFAFGRNQQPPQNEYADLPLQQELMGRFAWADATLDIQKDFNPTVWWDEDGYSYRMQTDGGAIIAAMPNVEYVPADKVVDTYFTQELAIAREVFLRRGFTLDQTNSSTSTADTRFYDYVQAYKKGDELCTVTVNTDYSSYEVGNPAMAYTLTANCANSLAQARTEQKPFLDALDLRYQEATARVENQSGDYYMVSFGYRRTGAVAIVKKEGDAYRKLAAGQEAPPCEVTLKEQIPAELVGNGCYENQ